MVFSALAVLDVVLALKFALDGAKTPAIIFGVLACAILAGSNFWFRTRVVYPILGLGDTAKRIADGSYGTLSEKLGEDEIGTLTDAINDMSIKIGKASRAQTDFISSVSHELRTPLTAIAGWSETLLYDEAIQDDSRRGVNIILTESGRLTNMAEELLEFTRIHDGRFTLNIETVDFAAVLEDVVFSYRELLRQEDIPLEYDPPEEELPPINGDPHRLRQVVLNILDNAAKHGKGGAIELNVCQNGEYIVTTVRDHGPGISAADLPHVKEKFYKGSTKTRGSGIGLAVCDEIVTRHGGTLLIANAEGGGTRVIVSLPVHTQ